MSSVLFVCLGNICRSPMAHGVMQHRLDARGLRDAVHVDSAGTGHWHVGHPPDPRTLAVLAERGVHLDHRARRLRPEDGSAFQWILTMDDENERAARRVVPPSAHARIRPVLSIVGGGEVPDPYYGGPGGFERIYALLVPAVDRWIDRITAG